MSLFRPGRRCCYSPRPAFSAPRAGPERRKSRRAGGRRPTPVARRSIDVKRDAEGIADAISADEIGRLPDKNAAENLERLPGVSLKYDQGEGRFVSIRGVDGALNNVTVNGVQVEAPSRAAATCRSTSWAAS